MTKPKIVQFQTEAGNLIVLFDNGQLACRRIGHPDWVRMDTDAALACLEEKDEDEDDLELNAAIDQAQDRMYVGEIDEMPMPTPTVPFVNEAMDEYIKRMDRVAADMADAFKKHSEMITLDTIMEANRKKQERDRPHPLLFSERQRIVDAIAPNLKRKTYTKESLQEVIAALDQFNLIRPPDEVGII